jgi:Putative Actinobacterial Holin-X, holin superfamily III
MSASGPPPGDQRPDSTQNIAATIAEVSERASVLVREEIELAKAEVSEKVAKLLRGAVVGIAAGVFVLTALVFALIGCAWLLYYYLPGSTFAYFWGFFAMAVILLALGVVAGLVAAKAVKRGAPPVPNMAIEEARKIRETVSSGPDAAAGAGAASAEEWQVSQAGAEKPG